MLEEARHIWAAEEAVVMDAERECLRRVFCIKFELQRDPHCFGLGQGEGMRLDSRTHPLNSFSLTDPRRGSCLL